MAIIELKNVTKTFGRQEILRGVNLSVKEGETKIILGGSGQGKSTILRLVLGFDIPDSGQILINNTDISRLSEEEMVPIRKRMGMVFQESSLFDSLTVFNNIAYRYHEEASFSEEEIVSKTERLLHLVDLEKEDLVKLPEQLSGGMKRRVAIARALAGQHKIMLYDEPTAGLDPITGGHITALMIRLRDLEKMTSLLVTQDLISSFQLSTHCAHLENDRINIRVNPNHPCTADTKLVVLKDGRILIEGTLAQLLQSSDTYVQQFLSSIKLIIPRSGG